MNYGRAFPLRCFKTRGELISPGEALLNNGSVVSGISGCIFFENKISGISGISVFALVFDPRSFFLLSLSPKKDSRSYSQAKLRNAFQNLANASIQLSMALSSVVKDDSGSEKKMPLRAKTNT